MKDWHHDRECRHQNGGCTHRFEEAFVIYFTPDSEDDRGGQKSDSDQRNCPRPGEARRESREGNEAGLSRRDREHPDGCIQFPKFLAIYLHPDPDDD